MKPTCTAIQLIGRVRCLVKLYGDLLIYVGDADTGDLMPVTDMNPQLSADRQRFVIKTDYGDLEDVLTLPIGEDTE